MGEPRFQSAAEGLENVLAKVVRYHPAPDLGIVRNAFEFAAEAHSGQMRKSGEPYITHPVGVADIVASLKLDELSLCAALLHDTVEDTDVTLEDIETRFGSEVAALVDGVTKLGKVHFSTKKELQAESFRKMLVAMSKDIRVLLVKLADRTHNMRTLKHMPPVKQRPIAQETLEIYAPLANRLGVSWLKTELEDFSFRYLYPEEYYDLVRNVDAKQGHRQEYTNRVIQTLEKKMRDNGLECEVTGRPKHLYSIWRKMKTQKIEYDQVFDAIAFRIIVDSVTQCYEALGVIHTHWKPIPGRFKDYIALSKPNLYRSLHTSVIGPDNERIEIQIRTAEMHRIAEEGIAAHWKYKEGAKMSLKDEQKFAWLKQLMEWQRELKDPTEFLDTVKVDLFSDEVYVFTPKGDVRVFPRGSTPVDFAYSVHTEVGHHCTGARIGGVMVPLGYKLRNGDVVEIMTRNTQRPNSDWLKFVKTSRAKNRIKALVRKDQRERSASLGRELLITELRKAGTSFSRFQKEFPERKLIEGLGGKVHSLDDLLVQLGYGKMQGSSVVESLYPDQVKKEAPDSEGEKPRPSSRLTGFLKALQRKRSGIIVDGIEDVMVRYGKCCNPVPGDTVVGFITRGRGVTVHARDCAHVDTSDPERRIDVRWDVKAAAGHSISIRVECTDSPGLLASISQSITSSSVNINQAHCRSNGDSTAVNIFHLEVENLDQLQGVMRAVERIKGVFSVERMRF